MTILAIDPGTTESGYVVWGGKEVLDHGIVKNADMLDVVNTSRSSYLAIEMVSHYGTGMPVGAEVFNTVLWAGRFIGKWEVKHSSASWNLIYRWDVKLRLCGSMKAKDANIRQALLDRLGPQGTKKSPGPLYGIRKHEWAALAVAVTTWDELKCV